MFNLKTIITENVFLVTISVMFFLWIFSHVPTLLYGVGDIPIHASYGSDEQGPINGALHILEDRSLLALRDAHNTQYGPLMSVLAVPAAGIDFIGHVIRSGVFSPESYKTAVLWDWTGILLNARILALAASFLALAAVYFIVSLANHDSVNRRWFALLGVLILATNFHFFEYATYFRHWIFIIAVLLWQVYFLERIKQDKGNEFWLWVSSSILTITIFGISYFGILFQILWLPSLLVWWRKNWWRKIEKFVYYVTSVAVGCALIVAWVPGPFYRAIGIGFSDISKQEVSSHINESYGTELSFGYYAEVVGSNNVALMLALAVMLYFLWRSRKLTKVPLLIDISLAITVYFIFFSIQSHHEPRYILPAIVLLLLLSSLTASKFFQVCHNKIWLIVVIGLMSFQVIYHSVHITRYLYLVQPGPAEQQLVARLLPILEANPGAKTLVLQDNLLGYPHTKMAYANYADRYSFEELGLFSNLQNDIHYQDDIFRLNADYFSMFHLPYDQLPNLIEYDLLVTHFRPNEPDIPNNRDACGVNIVNYWRPNICREQFDIVLLNQDYESAF